MVRPQTRLTSSNIRKIMNVQSTSEGMSSDDTLCG
jgi:hypothetical protein